MNSKIILSMIAAIAVVGSAGLFYGLSTTDSAPHKSLAVDEGIPTVIHGNPTSNLTLSSFETTDTLKKFSSAEELKKYLVEVEARKILRNTGSIFPDGTTFAVPFMMEGAVESEGLSLAGVAADKSQLLGSGTYSTTNVQVSNVDEPDFLKNDGKYTYIVSGDKLTIIDAYPAESAKIVLKIGLDVQGQNLQNIFLNKDRLVIFYQGSGEQYFIQQYDYIPTPNYMPTTHALVLDVSDKENPKIVKDYEVDGNYYNARMIGNYAYFIANTGVDYRNPILPVLKESSRTVMTPDVFYFDNPEEYYNFNTITAFDIFGDEINSETFMMGYANTIYVSQDNIYITYQKNLPYTYYEDHGKDRFFKIIVPLFPEEVQSQIKSIESSNLDSNEKWNKISDLLQDKYNSMSESEKNKLFGKIQNALEEYETKLQQET